MPKSAARQHHAVHREADELCHVVDSPERFGCDAVGLCNETFRPEWPGVNRTIPASHQVGQKLRRPRAGTESNVLMPNGEPKALSVPLHRRNLAPHNGAAPGLEQPGE